MFDAKSAVLEQFARDHAEAVAAARFFHNHNVEQAQLLAASLRVWAVEVREQDAPPAEEPILWRLLTTAAVETLAAAFLRVSYYRQRWQIEQFFRTLKQQGLSLESSQLRQGAALKKLCLVAVEAARVVMQLVEARDGSRLAAARLVFNAAEEVFLTVLCDRLSGGTAKQQNPHAAGTLAFASWVIARLGGWKCYGAPPGPIRMGRGLRRFAEQYAGWRLSGGSGSLQSSDIKDGANDVYGD